MSVIIYDKDKSILYNVMELSFSDLKKRDVINVADGSNLGHVSNVVIRFPEGRLVGIAVPGRRKRGLFAIFDKTELYIDEKRIIKIGGDVILVNLNCGDVCGSFTPQPPRKNKPNCPPQSPCQPPCPSPCASPRQESQRKDLKELFELDGEDY